MSIPHLLLCPSLPGEAQKSLKVLEDAFLNRKICLVNVSGIYCCKVWKPNKFMFCCIMSIEAILLISLQCHLT